MILRNLQIDHLHQRWDERVRNELSGRRLKWSADSIDFFPGATATRRDECVLTFSHEVEEGDQTR